MYLSERFEPACTNFGPRESIGNQVERCRRHWDVLQIAGGRFVAETDAFVRSGICVRACRLFLRP
jgi:hypothetical protein